MILMTSDSTELVDTLHHAAESPVVVPQLFNHLYHVVVNAIKRLVVRDTIMCHVNTGDDFVDPL